MKLKTFLDMLTEVELSQHIFGGLDEEGKLIKWYELINLINRGLEDIHTRFHIKRGELQVNVDSSKKLNYNLTSDENVLSEDPNVNIIKILEVWDECGNKQYINTIHRTKNCGTLCCNEITQIDKNTLRFENACGMFSVVYIKGPDLIERPKSVHYFFPDKIELDISLEYVDALIYYVVSKLFSINQPMNGYAAPYSPSVSYARKYEEECERLKNLNFEIDGLDNQYQRFYDSTFP